MVLRVFAKGQMILLEDDLGQTFFVIGGGSVKITRLSDDGREVILAMLGESDFKQNCKRTSEDQTHNMNVTNHQNLQKIGD